MKKKQKEISYVPDIKETHRIYAHNNKNDLVLGLFCLEFDFPSGEIKDVGFPTLNRMSSVFHKLIQLERDKWLQYIHYQVKFPMAKDLNSCTSSWGTPS